MSWVTTSLHWFGPSKLVSMAWLFLSLLPPPTCDLQSSLAAPYVRNCIAPTSHRQQWDFSVSLSLSYYHFRDASGNLDPKPNINLTMNAMGFHPLLLPGWCGQILQCRSGKRKPRLARIQLLPSGNIFLKNYISQEKKYNIKETTFAGSSWATTGREKWKHIIPTAKPKFKILPKAM